MKLDEKYYCVYCECVFVIFNNGNTDHYSCPQCKADGCMKLVETDLS